jgi:hypothetical protein
VQEAICTFSFSPCLPSGGALGSRHRSLYKIRYVMFGSDAPKLKSHDLLLLRISIRQPIARDTTNTASLRTLEDSLYSIAEALSLSTSIHNLISIHPKLARAY